MKFKGYFYAFLAAASYGTNPIFAKPLYADGMNPDSVLLFRYLLAVMVLIPMMAWNGYLRHRKEPSMLSLSAAMAQTFQVSRHSLPQLIVMGILMAMSSLTLFVSYNYMPVGIASTLLFVYPIMTALIMMLCFGEKLSWLVLGCLLLACGGIGLLCPIENGTFDLSGDFFIGFLIVMLSGLSYAIYLVGLNKTRLRTIASMPVTLYVLIFGTLVFVFRLMVSSPLTLPQQPAMWLNLLGLGILPTIVSLVFTAKAIQNIGSTQTALLGAMEPVTAVILGFFILGETVSLRDIMGMILIFIAVTLVVCRRK
ncbi:MAG: EamA family transporter [Bacteroidales bacterium]|nr:EamA family transporter [Bacteroidales bacterium]